jgi:hypothetical protein
MPVTSRELNYETQRRPFKLLLTTSGSTFSHEGRMIAAAIQKWATCEGQSRAVEPPRAEQDSVRLLGAYEKAKNPGWYAGEGEPVRIETFTEAQRFLDALPEFFRPTDIYPEPDGDLAFEWYARKDLLVTVSFDGRQRAIYVVRMPSGERDSGQVAFSTRIPEVIRFHLDRFFQEANGT